MSSRGALLPFYFSKCWAAVLPNSLCLLGSLAALALFLSPRAMAQSGSSFFVSAAQTNSTPSHPAIAVFTRDDNTGILTGVSGSPFQVNDLPTSLAFDVQGRYLFGSCAGDHVCMYTFDRATGAVAEVPGSPFASPYTNAPAFVAAESTGNYLIVANSGPPPSIYGAYSSSIEVYSIDPGTPPSIPPSLKTPATFVGSDRKYYAAVADPRSHAIYVLYGMVPESVNDGELDWYVVDTSQGAPLAAQGGTSFLMSQPRGLSVDPQGRFLVAAQGELMGSFSTFDIAASDGSLSVGQDSIPLSPAVTPAGIALDTTGRWLYMTVAGGIQLFDLSTFTVSPDSPLSYASVVEWAPNPVGSYLATPNAGIFVWPVDSSTGLLAATPVAGSPFAPGVAQPPFLYTRTSDQQPVSGPAVSLSPSAVPFGTVTVGQTSGPVKVKLTSNGDQALIVASITITGPNAASFAQTNTCTTPVLQPTASCIVTLTFSPTSAIAASASLSVSDNAPGSPHIVALTGTGVSPTPEVSFVPGTLTFPGTTTQGTSSAPQSVSGTNSGTASLQFSSVALSGLNAADFSISANTCTTSVAAGNSCSVTLVFSPLASGVRSTNLTLSNNAPNSPQSISVSGTAPAAAVVAPGTTGNTSASITAGQTAQFSLQVTPGTGFSGNVTFTCTGAPKAAACSVPSGVAVAGGNASLFTVSVTTTGAASAQLPTIRFPGFPSSHAPFFSASLLALLGLLVFFWNAQSSASRRRNLSWRFALPLIFLCLSFSGCGGGPTSERNPPPPNVTPAGTYSLTLTPTATPAGSSNTLALSPVTLTLVVN